MPNKIKLLFQLLINMGPRYLAYRVYFELKKRIGVLKIEFPTNPHFEKFISLTKWKDETIFLIKSRRDYAKIDYPFQIDHQKFKDQKNGLFEFFSSLYFNLGENFDWITNPDTGYKYDINKHWSEINDFDPKIGDIKYVWEKSRFSFIYLAIRSDIKNNTDSSEYVLSEIINWIDNNPINQGPNYKCSQEISLRIINWTYALHFYRDSIYLNENRLDKILHVVYWQIKHVYSNINFSKIAVRNNHAITETLLLYIAGLVYPFFPESKIWKKRGKKWFEKEIEYQIYSDGTYLQFSMNYHRVVVQLLNLSFIVADKFNESFNDIVYQRAYQTLNFLYQSQDLTSGMLPNYGANDGALFFPLSSCNFRDFRPSLNTLHVLLTGKKLYNDGPWVEECFLLSDSLIVKKFPIIQKNFGWNRFEIGGYYILNEKETMTFVRCGNHYDRPSQSDNLHIDIWHKSVNLLYDAGSYKYNTNKENINYFFGTESHNTVMLDNYNQMLKGGRFIWYYWTNSNKVSCIETSEGYEFLGEISAFQFLKKNIKHQRRVFKQKEVLKWNVTDTILNKPIGSTLRQLWHPEMNYNDQFNIISSNATVKQKNGFVSNTYGRKDVTNYFSLESNNNLIETIFYINENFTSSSAIS